MKKHNPNIPILIREAQGIEPRVWARYGKKSSQEIWNSSLTLVSIWPGSDGSIEW